MVRGKVLLKGMLSVMAMSIAPCSGAEEASARPGELFRQIAGDELDKEYKFNILGWAEGSYVASDSSSENVLPQGFFNVDDGTKLNQLGLMFCRGSGCPTIVTGPIYNVVGRVGPLPGPRREEFDLGFNVTTVYGEDVQFFRTADFDDWSFDDSEDEKLAIPQIYLDMYLPVADGMNLMVGTFQTGLGNEIGYPFIPPNWFATHTYSFAHGPGKHIGALAQVKIPTSQEFGLLSMEGGLVANGWNTAEEVNLDQVPAFLASLRWRSPNMKTWVDVELIYGDGEGDFAEGPARGGSPYFAVSSSGERLDRFDGFIVVSHELTERTTLAVEANYGSQEGGDVAPAPFFITRDSPWYGINAGIRYQVLSNLHWNTRGEWFKDEDGANIAWAGSPGTVYAATMNLDWAPVPFFHLRPEVRYDTYTGDGLPLFADKTEDNQLLGILNAVLYF